MRFEGNIWQDKKSKYWVVEIPILDLVTQGTSRRNAFLMAKDAVKSLVDKKTFEINGVLGDDNSFTIGSEDSKTLISLLLQRQRMKSGLSFRVLAKRMNSTSPNAFAQYERGKRTPNIETLNELLKAIDPKIEPVLSLTYSM